MTTYEEWRVTGAWGDQPYEFSWSPARYSQTPEADARRFVAKMHEGGVWWSDGPHLHKRRDRHRLGGRGMTTSTIRFMHCDFAGCDAQAPKPFGEGYVAERPDGWTDAIYTHGCPEHGKAIAKHQANVTSQTRGRGSREKTTWFLTCACGWRPNPNFQTYSASWLHERHVKHVAAVTVTEWTEVDT